jgi:hypothetical protein
LTLNLIHQILLYADDDNSSEYNVNIVMRSRRLVNTERFKYMLMLHHQNAGQEHNINTTNTLFEIVIKLKYWACR